jgi:hypothetical protein
MLGCIKMKFNKVAAAAAVIAILAGLIYFAFDKALIAAVSAAYDLEIGYTGLERPKFGELRFSNLKASRRAGGIGISAKDARITVIRNASGSAGFGLSFELLDASFTGSVNSGGSYDTLDGLASMPLGGGVLYSEIFGTVVPVKGGVSVKDLMARSRDMRLSFNGTIGDNKTVEADAVIYFSEALKNKVPKELTDVILSQEADNWYSLSVHLSGDYNAPSVNVSSKLFRLNIRSVIK